MNKLKIANLYLVKGNNTNKAEKIHMYAKPHLRNFTVMFIIIPVKLVDLISSTQGTNNTTLWNGFTMS
jgi:hypothetical protein